MKKSTKAALLSGLVFPGVGHMLLKHYLRGSMLMLCVLIALSVIVTTAIRQALAIVEGISNGEIPIDTVSLAELVSNSTSASEGSIMNIATLVIVACWIIGIVDSYRLGNTRESIVEH